MTRSEAQKLIADIVKLREAATDGIILFSR